MSSTKTCAEMLGLQYSSLRSSCLEGIWGQSRLLRFFPELASLENVQGREKSPGRIPGAEYLGES